MTDKDLKKKIFNQFENSRKERIKILGDTQSKD